MLSDPDTIRMQLNLPGDNSKSQLNQDVFALLVNRFRPGFFIEIGANDGHTLSNTYYLEKHFDWKGILIEPNPKYWTSLSARKAQVCRKAVASEAGREEFHDAGLYGGISATISDAHSDIVKSAGIIEVETDTLPNILKELGAPKRIDFVSIDVEGGEVAIVEQMIALSDHQFFSGCIEHGNRQDDKERMSCMLRNAGYELLWPENSTQDLFFVTPKLA